ncbi:dystrophia myotonica WD repeat-containing-like protein [Achlya hypogyna]|uniref:Dystrophia myotonica WD repeat-containing-like protein n=1 Tax=Achlya hypogyna TaxID=1202772 RepID=A0A1V9YD17_ACHHY|nr:dystrophia myotonica WD repeat-containing-like protein [Achlya hypogyna]
MSDLRTTAGSVYRFVRDFVSMDVLRDSQSIALHEMVVPIGEDAKNDGRAHRRYHWNHNCGLSFVKTKTYIPYRKPGGPETPTAASTPDAFILHNLLDYVFVYPYPALSTPVDVMHFNSTPISHDFRVPMMPTQPTNVVLALLSSDIVVFDPLHGLDTFSHHNRKGSICSSPVTVVKWVLQSHTEFVVAHESGDVYFYDHTWRDESLVDMVAEEGTDFPIRCQREDRMNPTLHWQMATSAVYDVAFSPHGKYLATVGRDGALTVVQYHLQRKIALMKSSFGALLTLAWSPDSNYIITGGQDDSVTLWSLRHNAAIVRCEGHRSWITCVAFDVWFCSPTSLRFGSVGEDGMLCFWDVALPDEHHEEDETNGGATPTPDCHNLDVPSLAVTLFAGPASQLEFRERTIAVSARDGTVHVYSRPSQDCFPAEVLAQNIPTYSIS